MVAAHAVAPVFLHFLRSFSLFLAAFLLQIAKKRIFFAFFWQKIWSCQKIVVILHRDSEKEHKKLIF